MRTLRHIFSYARPHRRLLARTVVLQVVQIALALSLPLLLREAIDRGLALGDVQYLIFLGLATVGLTALRSVIWYIVNQGYQNLYALVGYDLRDRIYEKVQRSSYAFLTRARSGDLFSLSSTDLGAVEEFFNGGVNSTVNLVVLTTFITLSLLQLDPGLTLIAFGIVPVLAAIAILYAPVAREQSRLIQHQNGQVSATLQENLNGMRVVKAFAGEKRETSKFQEQIDLLFEYSMRSGRLNAWVFPLMSLITFFGMAAILWFGGNRVIEGTVSLGTLIATLQLLMMLVQPVRQLGGTINVLSGAIAGTERIQALLDHRDMAESEGDRGAKPDMPQIRGGFSFQDVSFSYSRVGEPVLKEIGVEAEPGESVGVVGLTGAGKTTLTLLLGRFYDPTRGVVRIDGVDIRTVNVKSLRRQIGYVFQDPFLFSASIAENIAFGRPDASRAEIESAATAACLHDFVVTLPEGYETQLGERGITLSGGQRQRLSLARALLIEPRILILDDTTSALDPVTAAEIWHRVTARRRGLTTIVVAQRLASVREADRIIVLEHGRIAERGRHDDLVAAGALYARLWNRQAAQSQDQIDHEQLRLAADAKNGHAIALALPPEESALPPAQPDDARKKDVLALSVEDDSIQGRPYDSSLMRRMLEFARPFKHLMVLSLVAMIGWTLGALAGPYAQKLVIDNALVTGDAEKLAPLVGFYLAAAIMMQASGANYGYLLNRTAYEVLRNLRMTIFRHLQALSLSFYDRYKVGRLMSIMSGDVQAISNLLSNTLVMTAGDVLILLGVIVAMVSMQPQLSALVLSVVPAIVIVTLVLRREIRRRYREWRRHNSIANGALAENIAGARVTQAYCREVVNRRNFDVLNRNLRDALFSATRLAAAFGPTMDFIASIAHAMLIVYGGGLIIAGEMSIGVIVVFISYTQRFFEPIRDLTVRYNQVQAAMAGAERITALLDTPPAVVDRAGARELLAISGRMRFHDVQFAYVPGRPVLHDLSLEIRPGEHVAIVGPTGAGKSSIISLACRFYDVTSGAIVVDGHRVDEVTQESLRRQIGVVLQDPFLFSGTIAENLRFGKPDATPEEMEEVCRAVGLHEHVVSLPLGYQTILSERGVNLSAGQRQLLSFARALLVDPKILILDEATANVDTETEAQVQEALRLLLTGRTAIVIAHRLSTIRSVDRIIVLEAGRIAEIGNHQELLRAGGHYARLHHAAVSLA